MGSNPISPTTGLYVVLLSGVSRSWLATANGPGRDCAIGKNLVKALDKPVTMCYTDYRIKEGDTEIIMALQIVRFRVKESDLVDDTNEIHYGVAHGDGFVWCGCGCGGNFETEECEILDSYEPTEDVLAGLMGWPWSQGGDPDEDIECPIHDVSCPYFHEGGCLLDHPETDCDDYIAMMDDPWEVDDEGHEASWELANEGEEWDDCDNDEGYDPYEGCYTGDC